MRGHRRRSYPHAAELRHFEGHIVPANAVRPIQGGPFGSQANGHRHQQHRHQQDQSRQTAQKNIKDSFHSSSTEAACTNLLTLSAKNRSLHSDKLSCSAAGRKGATSCAARGQLMVFIFAVMASPSHSALTTVFWSFHGPAWLSAWARCGKLGRIFCLQYQAKSNQSRPFR